MACKTITSCLHAQEILQSLTQRILQSLTQVILQSLTQVILQSLTQRILQSLTQGILQSLTQGIIQSLTQGIIQSLTRAHVASHPLEILIIAISFCQKGYAALKSRALHSCVGHEPGSASVAIPWRIATSDCVQLSAHSADGTSRISRAEPLIKSIGDSFSGPTAMDGRSSRSTYIYIYLLLKCKTVRPVHSDTLNRRQHGG